MAKTKVRYTPEQQTAIAELVPLTERLLELARTAGCKTCRVVIKTGQDSSIDWFYSRKEDSNPPPYAEGVEDKPEGFVKGALGIRPTTAIR